MRCVIWIKKVVIGNKDHVDKEDSYDSLGSKSLRLQRSGKYLCGSLFNIIPVLKNNVNEPFSKNWNMEQIRVDSEEVAGQVMDWNNMNNVGVQIYVALCVRHCHK